MPDPTIPATAPHAIGGAHLITRDTNLRVDSFNSAAGVTLTIVVRSLGFDGAPIVDIFQHTPNTDRTIRTDTYYLSEGWLVSVQAYASSGSPRRGQCFIRVQLIQGLTGATLSLATLLQGYAQDTTALAYPGSAIEASTSDRGVIRSIAGTNPAAGVEISETVPTNVRWRLITFTYTLVTDATVATRISKVVLDDGTNLFHELGASSSQAASQNFRYAGGEGLGALSGAASNVMIAWPVGVYLLGGYRVRTSTNAIQAGDDYGAPQYLVEEWIED